MTRGSVEPPTEPTGPFGTGPGGWSVEPPGAFGPPGTDPTPLWVNYAKSKGQERSRSSRRLKLSSLSRNQEVTLEGEPEPANGNKDIERQNQAAEALKERGLKVKYLPNPHHREGNPDLEISTDGGISWKKADVKSPTSKDMDQIRALIQSANTKQHVNVVSSKR